MNLDIFFHISGYLDSASYLSLRLTSKELYDYLDKREISQRDILEYGYSQLIRNVIVKPLEDSENKKIALLLQKNSKLISIISEGDKLFIRSLWSYLFNKEIIDILVPIIKYRQNKGLKIPDTYLPYLLEKHFPYYISFVKDCNYEIPPYHLSHIISYHYPEETFPFVFKRIKGPYEFEYLIYNMIQGYYNFIHYIVRNIDDATQRGIEFRGLSRNNILDLCLQFNNKYAIEFFLEREYHKYDPLEKSKRKKTFYLPDISKYDNETSHYLRKRFPDHYVGKSGYAPGYQLESDKRSGRYWSSSYNIGGIIGENYHYGIPI